MNPSFKTAFAFSALLAGLSAHALTAGDLAIVAYNTDSDDNFAWVALTDIAANTTVNFTDSSWQATAFRSTEHVSAGGPLTWSFGSAVTAGTVIQYNGRTPNTWSVGAATGIGLTLATDGDQIFAFTGTVATPSFLTGAQFAHASGIVASPTVSTSTNTTNVPLALNVGTTMVDGGNFDNGYYNGITTGTQAQLLAAVGNTANWVRSDSVIASNNWVSAMTVTPVPEPSTYALMLAGLAAVGRVVQRRRATA